jgi:hypothetical protein
MFRKRIGISSYISSLLLIVLAVSAGVFVFAYFMGYIGGFSLSEKLGTVSVDDFSANETCILIHVRNVGGVGVNFSQVYVEGEQAHIYNRSQWKGISDGNWVSTDEGGTGVAYIELNGVKGDEDFTTGKTYEVKLVANDNTQTNLMIKPD